MIVKEAKVTDEEAKKDVVLRFASLSVQEEWTSLTNYAPPGKFDDWVAEIEELFPEIKAFKTGSISRLQEICNEHIGIKKSDQGLIKRLNLQFKLEATKLKNPPSLVTNTALVDKYLTCFEPSFALEIGHMISRVMYDQIAGLTKATNPLPALVDRPERTIELDELFILVERLSKINVRPTTAGMSLSSAALPTSGAPTQAADWAKTEMRIKDEVRDQVEAGFAQIKDTLVLHKKEMRAELAEESKKSRADFKQTMEQYMGQSNWKGRDAPPHKDIVQAGQSPNRDGEDRTFRQPNRDCFYCYLGGHMVRDCPYKKEHIDSGKILIEGGRMKLGDGSAFPRWPESKSQKQRVDDYYANKVVPGAPVVLFQHYLHPRIDQITQFQQDLVDNLNSVYDSRDDEIRCFQVQRIIGENKARLEAYHPVASFQQNQYQPQVFNQAMPTQVAPNQAMAMFNPGTVQTYSPAPQVFQTQQPLNFPVTPQAAPQAQVAPTPGMIDLSQFAQMAQIVDAVRGSNGLPTNQAQFAQTRQSTKEGQTPSPN